MDLLNTAVHQLERQGVSVVLDRCSSPLDETRHASCADAAAAAELAVSSLIPRSTRRSALRGYVDRLFTMLGFMGSVAMGPSGPHAHFLRHSIDALTIRSVDQGGRGGTDKGACSKSLRGGTGALLSLVRNISNLEEELHHSFFAYIMLSTKAFVSIGKCSHVQSFSIRPCCPILPLLPARECFCRIECML